MNNSASGRDVVQAAKRARAASENNRLSKLIYCESLLPLVLQYCVNGTRRHAEGGAVMLWKYALESWEMGSHGRYTDNNDNSSREIVSK